MKEARRWWIEDNDGNRTEPADCAKHRYLEVIEAAPVEAEIERLKSLISWLRDGIQHFEDEGQVNHLTKRIDEVMREK